MSTLLELSGISKDFGGLHALRDVSFALPAGEVVGLIGPNGAGKTTVVNLVTGVHPVSTGRIVFAGGGTRLRYEVVGWNELVERLEVAGADGRLALARETRFKRGSSKLALKPGTTGDAGATAAR